jgi:hypothetical protein
MAEPTLEATIARRGGAILLLLPALLLLMMFLLAAASKDTLAHTIEHSHELEAKFKEAALFVDVFREERGRLPNSDETERHLGRGGPYVVAAGDGFFQDAVAELGQPPEAGYFLGLWRGEWMEYYASWSGKTTMPSDESAYYLFGSRIADSLIGVFGALFCLAGSVALWRSASRD